MTPRSLAPVALIASQISTNNLWNCLNGHARMHAKVRQRFGQIGTTGYYVVGSPTVDLIQGAFLVLHVERIEELYVMY